MADETSSRPRLCQHNFDERPNGESSRAVNIPSPTFLPNYPIIPHPRLLWHNGLIQGTYTKKEDLRIALLWLLIRPLRTPWWRVPQCVNWRWQPETTGAITQIEQVHIPRMKDLCICVGEGVHPTWVRRKRMIQLQYVAFEDCSTCWRNSTHRCQGDIRSWITIPNFPSSPNSLFPKI